jgi:PAS domain S-box-containing protein
MHSKETSPRNREELQKQNEELRLRLAEAEETLRAIRNREADAVVVSGSQGEQIFSPVGAESIYRLIVETMQEAAFTVSLGGIILYCNVQFSHLVKRPMDQIVGRALLEFAAGESQLSVSSLLKVAGGHPVKQRFIFKNAESLSVPTLISANALKQPEGVGICIVANDLTELENASEVVQPLIRQQEALRESEERLRFALETSHIGAWELDLVSHVAFRSPQHARIFGYPEVLPGWTFEKFLEHVLPEDREAVSARFQQAVSARSELNFECRIRRVDGEVRWIWVAARHQTGLPEPMSRMTGIVQDITERMRAELEREKLQSQLNQAQRMESVGRLAGGIAHDFNNKLAVVLGYAELALGQTDRTDPIYEALEEIIKAAQSSAELTRQLLAFARKQTVAPHVLDLNDTVEGILRMLRQIIGEEITLAWLPGTGLPSIMMDSNQIEQMLVNLCVNARGAIRGAGKITIETGVSALDEASCPEYAGSPAAEFVLLAISDTGCGMSKEVLAHVFEPFFTTKKMGQGTGMGLATVHGIVRQNGGFITATSEPGRGTTFRIFIPPHEPGTAWFQNEATVETAVSRQKTILLVEDEPAILRLGKQMLEGLGYRVLLAATPGEAIRRAEEHAGEVHLLITDVMMPEMNGWDLAQKLLLIYPNMKRLFMSGHSADVISRRGVLEGGIHFMQKPFTRSEMAEKIQKALE